MPSISSLLANRRTSTLAAVCLAAVVLPLSFTGGAIAIPAIGRELGGSSIELSWITNAFMLTFGSLLMAAGAMADQFGRKRVFAIGICVFTVISALLCLTHSVLLLNLLRGAQGVAAAAALAGGTAALAQEFEGHARTRAFSVLGTTFGVGLAFGPMLSGALLEWFGWPAIFLSTAVLGGLAVVLGLPFMHESKDPNAAGLDWWGTVIFSSLLATFTFAVIRAPMAGWDSPDTLFLFGLALILLLVFVHIELHCARPMLDLSLFKYPRFIGVQMLPVGTCYSYIVLIVLLPLRFIGVEGMSALEAGTLMFAISCPMLFMPSLVATMARWIAPGLLSATGFLISAIGLYWLSLLPFGNHGGQAIFSMLLIGIGAGMPWGLMDGLSVSVVPKERAGMATGIFNTSRVAGEGIALAMVTAILATLVQRKLQHSLTTLEVDAWRIAEAAQRLAIGDLKNATLVLPHVDRAMLISSYSNSFNQLLWLLIAITLASAIVVALSLGKGRAGNASTLVKQIES